MARIQSSANATITMMIKALKFIIFFGAFMFGTRKSNPDLNTDHL